MAASHLLKLEPGTLVGHYTVESLISSGGFGAVYKVHRDGQPFALKVPLTRSPSEEARKVTEARIVREVVSLMSLKHPGIVGVHGFDRWPDPVTGALYLVMDFVDGQPLMRWRAATSPSLREILGVFRQLALAVEAMHAMGVVHRDIKSSNCLVSRVAAPRSAAAPEATSFDRATHSTGSAHRPAGPDASRIWQPVLVDFGLARPTFTADVTAEHVVVGTEGNLAPELLATSGKHFHYTPATDLYALGRLFFEVLTGVADPYRPTTSFCRRNLRLPSNVARGLTPLVDPIVTDLLATDPARRTPSAGELARQLDALLADARWGDTLPVRASFFVGKGLDLEGRFITRAEGQPRATPPFPAPTSATAEFGAPTLPMFLLDSNETLAGRVLPPAAVGEAPQSVQAAPTVRREADVSPSKRWRQTMRQVLGVLAQSCMVWVVVLMVLRGLTSLADAEVEGGAPDRMEPSSATTPPAPPPAAPAPVPRESRAAQAPRERVETPRPVPTRPPPVMVRAALLGHAQPGPVRALLRQPVQLANASLPTGTTLEGTADTLPDGRFLLRFDSAAPSNGPPLSVKGTALVGANAAMRRPLTPGGSHSPFEFDLAVVR